MIKAPNEEAGAALAAAAEPVSPFDLLLDLESRIRNARIDSVAGQSQTWVGLTFRLRKRWFVAPRADIREVIVPPPLTRVPGTRPWLRGIANVRGSLLPVTDLGQLFGDPPLPDDRAGRTLVFNSDRVPAGFLVDEVSGYRHFIPADQRHSLVAETGDLAPYLLGAFVRDGRSWPILSLRKLVSTPLFLGAS
jgi:twitching motility protein PilI